MLWYNCTALYEKVDAGVSFSSPCSAVVANQRYLLSLKQGRVCELAVIWRALSFVDHDWLVLRAVDR